MEEQMEQTESSQQDGKCKFNCIRNTTKCRLSTHCKQKAGIVKQEKSKKMATLNIDRLTGKEWGKL